MDIGMLKQCIGSLEKNIYFSGANENGQDATIYAKDEQTRSQLIELLHKRLDHPAFKSIKIETTRSLKLKKTRSLEDILARIPHQNIYLDPTATIERATVLVAIAKDARQLLGSVLKGCYFNSERRNVYFLIDADSNVDLSALQSHVEPIIMRHTKRLTNPFYYSITISVQKPQGRVIAVDKASIVHENLVGLMKGLVRKLKWPLLVVASATGTLGIAARAENGFGPLPAVSNPNGWIGAAGSYLNNNKTDGIGVIAEGGIAVPIGQTLGAQLHTYDGIAGSATILSVDGYIFWRNPAQGLIGPHVLYTKSNSYHHTLYGLHGEGYLNEFTLVIEGGGANRNDRSNSYYGEAIVHWYAQPDWRLYAGAINVGGSVTGQIGTEYQFGLSSLPGLAIFADAGVGAHNLSYGYLGLRYYFGEIREPNKPLIRRQREDMVLPTLDPIDPRKPNISHM